MENISNRIQREYVSILFYTKFELFDTFPGFKRVGAERFLII